MANLSKKIILLLDKLYNLKGEDNIVLQNINSETEGIKSDVSSINDRKVTLETEKTEKSTDLEMFKNQQEQFLACFSSITDDTFASLKNIGVDVNIASMFREVSEKAPEYISSSSAEIADIQKEIDEGESKKTDLESRLATLDSNRAKAEEDKNILTGLMEQCLSDDESERDSLSIRYIKDILNRFGLFEPSEIVTLAQVLMFPEENGLLDYDKEYPERLQKGEVGEADAIAEEEPKIERIESAEIHAAEIEPEKEEEQPVTTTTTFETPAEMGTIGFYDKKEDAESVEVVDLSSLNHAEEDNDPEKVVEEIETTEPEETIETYLESIGMDLNKFQEENDKEKNIASLMEELSTTDKTLITNNYEMLRSVNAETAAYRYRKGHSYLTDKELSQKITLLRSKNISEATIKTLLEQADSGMRESLATLVARFKAAEELETPINDEHIDLLGHQIEKLQENIALLEANEISIDPKERRNYIYPLTNSQNVNGDLEILKNYLINITRNNDKYALGIFAKDPYALLMDIDTIIENGLEDVLSTNPEVLESKRDSFVERYKFYQKQGKPTSDPTGRQTYASYIINPLEAFKENGNKTPEVETLPSVEETNKALPSVIGTEEVTKKLVTILDEYYTNRTEFKDIKLSATGKDTLARLTETLENAFHAESVGKYTYKLGENFISKLKAERQLKVIITNLEQNNETIYDKEKLILLVAILYNVRQTPATLKKIVETCLGSNEQGTIGGNAL